MLFTSRGDWNTNMRRNKILLIIITLYINMIISNKMLLE